MIGTAFLRHRLLPAMLFSVLALTACDDDDENGTEPEPEVVTMRLTAGAQVVTVSNNGTVTNGPIVVPVGTTALTLEFLDDTGNPDPLVTDADFEARVTPTPATVLTADRTSAFAFTLTGVAEGSATLSAELFHLEEGHSDFGPFDVPVTVEPAP
jgi:hypothetical protein